MSMMGGMSGRFQYDGKDMVYDIHWRVDEGDLTVYAYPENHTAPDLFDALYETTQDDIIEIIKDETTPY